LNKKRIIRIAQLTLTAVAALTLAGHAEAMGMSLAFHIIFAAIGVSLPLMMTISEWRWRSTGDPAYLLLAKRWSKGATILFAVGAI
jgi:cytochrome bd-type quinol oxidase subunit 1